MKYSVISCADVDVSTQIAAHRALATARKELRLPMVNIKWFVSARDAERSMYKVLEIFDHADDVRGLFVAKEPSTIYVCAMQLPDGIMETVIHETFHVWQKRADQLLNEKHPDAFASDLLAQIRAHGKDDSIYLEHMAGKDWSEANPQERNVMVPPALLHNDLPGDSAHANVQKSMYLHSQDRARMKYASGCVILKSNLRK